MNRLLVYLDIDGTILYEPHDGSWHEELDYQRVGEGLPQLLEFVVAHCEPYWLSYRARRGRTDALAERLFPYLPPIARQIPPAYWDRSKHEGLSLSRPFVWFDDDPEETDLAWLAAHNRLDALVRMDPHEPQNPARIHALLETAYGCGTTPSTGRSCNT